MRRQILSLAFAVVGWGAACNLDAFDPGPNSGGPGSGGATIVGRVMPASATSKLHSLAQDVCPGVVVTLNGAPVTVDFDDNCAFLVTDPDPTALLELRVELPDLALAGIIELVDVVDGELIEIEVEVGDDSLTIHVVRRVAPGPSDVLPAEITDDDVSILLVAGDFDQTLTVHGDNFTLVGEAGETCDSEGWTRILGDVVIIGDGATFVNIAFEGNVEVHGEDTRFIHSCFGGELIVFGDGDDGEDNDDADDDDDHDDKDDDKHDDDD